MQKASLNLSNQEQKNRIIQLEELRQLIKIALMNDSLSEKEYAIISRKAISIGIDSDIFEIQMESLIHLKNKACKRLLFRKRTLEEYFNDRDCLENICGFDADFNKVFLSNEECVLWKKYRNKQFVDEMYSIFDGYSEILRGFNTVANVGVESMKTMSIMSKFTREISEDIDTSIE